MRQCEVSDHNLPGALDLQPYGFLLQLHTATVYIRKLALEEKIFATSVHDIYSVIIWLEIKDTRHHILIYDVIFIASLFC